MGSFARSRPTCRQAAAIVGKRSRTFAVEMREGQEDAAAGPRRFAHDAARHDVARREIAVGMVARHERLAVAVDEPGPLAAHRFGNQEPRCVRMVQRRRMELHELEVADARARVEGERDAIAGRDRRVGGFAKHLAGPAGRQQRPRRAHASAAAPGCRNT